MILILTPYLSTPKKELYKNPVLLQEFWKNYFKIWERNKTYNAYKNDTYSSDQDGNNISPENSNNNNIRFSSYYIKKVTSFRTKETYCLRES